jgi:Zn-dependent protease
VRGIEIKVHPTFLLVLPWVVWNWGYMGGYGPVGVAFGLVLTLVLFMFVLLHELGHGFAALHYGIGVRDITLLPIGGVARIEQLALKPGREVVIALAGPAVNLTLALLFTPPILLIARARQVTNPLELLLLIADVSPTGFIIYLFFTNLVLAAFNLLPAFPLDGGRVLRACLSFFTQRFTATSIAAGFGQVLALGLCALGLATGNPSLILMAAFIAVAAYLEWTAIRVEHTLRKLKVGQFILWDMGGVAAHHPLPYALRGGPRDVAVINGDRRVVGMLWRHDVMEALNGGASRFRTVGELMDIEAAVADVDDTIFEVQQRMVASGRRALPVTENGLYRGIFTTDRFWHVHRHVARRPHAQRRARLRRLAEPWLRRRIRPSNR